MNKINKIFKDILYISKLTKTKNKKILIITSISLSQVSAGIDLLLIASFASIVASQVTNVEIINSILEIIDKYRILIVLLVTSRYIVTYLQSAILKKIELSSTISLRVYLFSKVLEQKNFSTADSWYYINTLSTHIAFFYSNFAQLLNYFLQACAYVVYLLISDTQLVGFFGLGIIILGFPIAKLLSASRKFIREEYNFGADANKELVNVLENLPLIKILRMEELETNSFYQLLSKIYSVVYKNFQVQIINAQLPNFFTLFIFSIMLNISSLTSRLTLDVLGVTVRLFQSLSSVSTALNKVINSQIHIKEFVKLENISIVKNKDYLSINKANKIELKEIDFKYVNSEDYIFKNLNLELDKNTHNLIIGSNGSGKSTLLGILGNILIPESGKLSTFSKKFSYIGATPFIFNTTMRKNILYGNSEEVNDSKIIDLLKEFNLFNENISYDLDRVIDNKSLSSGQMQKIGFIRALLIRPEILLLDESMANLDDASKSLIMSIISQQNITLINSTHDPEIYKNVDSIIQIDIVDEKRVLKVTK
jgi:ABC-type multidrug transport system fused ATPase/permease subunit